MGAVEGRGREIKWGHLQQFRGKKIYGFTWKAGRTVCENGVEGQAIPGPVTYGGADWMWGAMGQED